jgi:hypothetical protein
MRLTTLLIIALALARVAGTAHADGGAVMVGGKSPLHEKTIATNAAREALRASGKDVIDRSFTAKDLDAVTGCIRKPPAWPCVEGVLRDKRIQHVAVVSVDPHSGRTVKITQRMLVARAESVISGQRFCEQCTDDTLAANTTELTKELLVRVAIESGRTVLIVKSTPTGARVSLDGASIGATDLSTDIAPGHHTVKIEREGYETEVREIDAVEGKTADVSVKLQLLKTGTGTNSSQQGKPNSNRIGKNPRRPSLLLPAVVSGVGVIGLATGIVVLALDKDPVTVRDKQVRSSYTDTTAVGLGITIGSAAVCGVSVYLWSRYVKASGTPSIAPAKGGAVVGWIRAF